MSAFFRFFSVVNNAEKENRKVQNWARNLNQLFLKFKISNFLKFKIFQKL